MRSSNRLALAALGAAAAWPAADLLFANSALPLSPRIALWTLALAAAAVAAASLLQRPLRSFARAAAVTAVPFMAFFAFPAVEPAIRWLLVGIGLSRGAVPLFLLLWTALLFATFRASNGSEGCKWLLVVPLFLFGTTSVAVLVGLLAGARAAPLLEAANPTAVFVRRPNVYHFLFDGLARPDVLKATYAIDLSQETALLEAAGFTTATAVQTRYLDTVASINGILDPGRNTNGATDLVPTATEVVRTFRANGYNYAHYGEVFAFAGCKSDEDVCLTSDGQRLTEIDIAFIRRTPTYQVWKRRLLAGTDSRNLVANIEHVATKSVASPAFRFSYMVPPHPPFLFQRDCTLNERQAAGFIDWEIVAINHYAESYRCVMRTIAAAAKRIAAADPEAVIIVSGDHGTMFRRQGKAWSAEALAERRPVFLAVRAPEECRPAIAQLRQLNHLYPILFSCLSRTKQNLSRVHGNAFRNGNGLQYSAATQAPSTNNKS
ncbi:MAG: hypothetical protein WCO82_04995 [Sphingomonadales bacterium]|jgi:hypothetical protein